MHDLSLALLAGLAGWLELTLGALAFAALAATYRCLQRRHWRYRRVHPRRRTRPTSACCGAADIGSARF